MGDLEAHAEVAGEPEQIRRALPALLGARLIRIVEVAAVEPHLLHARHHGVGERVGDGGVQEVIADCIDGLLDREGDRHGKLGIGRTRDDGAVVPAEEFPVGRKGFLLHAEVVHDPELVVREELAAEVHGPDLFPRDRRALHTDHFPIGHPGHPEPEEDYTLGTRLEAIGWVHAYHPLAVQ